MPLRGGLLSGALSKERLWGAHKILGLYTPIIHAKHHRQYRHAVVFQCHNGIPARGRLFHTTMPIEKKRTKQQGNDDGLLEAHGLHGSSQTAVATDIFDFADLHHSIAEAQERLRNGLRQATPGRGIQQEHVEAVRVKMKGSAESVRLSDIAQVVPKGGRKIGILVGQQETVRAITSAVLSELDVNPVPTTFDPLELHITVPPATQESRAKARQQVSSAGEKALQAVRQARSNQQKQHRTMELSKKFRPDDLRRASKKMEEIVERGNNEVKKITETAKKAMDR